MKLRDREHREEYKCQSHSYARYQMRDDYLAHLELAHGLDIRNPKILKDYMKQNGVWIDR